MNVGDVVLTQVVLSHSGRMLFAGTSSGTVRAIKFPLTDPGEWQDHQAHSTAVTRVSIVGEGVLECIVHYLHVVLCVYSRFVCKIEMDEEKN